MLADQLFPAIPQALAGLAIDVKNGGMIVKQEERVGCVIRKSAEARFARTDLLLRLAQLRDVLQDAELAQRPTGVVPCHVALAADSAHAAVGPRHAIFHVIAGTAAHERGRGGLGDARAVLGVKQVEPARVQQVDGLHTENPADLVGKS